ncbi:MAG: hypothetical protein JW737_01020 [Acidobacteria bacterium]|nr:hypothetical protein [Acidobacteriota bacterium]
MRKSIEVLIKMQEEIDAERKLIVENESIPERIKSLEDKLQNARSSLQQAEAKQKENLTNRLKQEEEIKLNEAKKLKLQEQLMNVKNNDQYKATLKDIDFLDKTVAKAEENILYLMEDEDITSKKVKEAKTVLVEQEQVIKKEEDELQKIKINNETKIAEIQSTRQELKKQVEPELLERFEIMASKKPYIGIASLRDDHICSVCRFKIRPQIWAELMSDQETHHCDNCQRILYYIPPEIDE